MGDTLQCPTCPEANTTVEDWHNGDRVCSSCGLVLEAIVDQGGAEITGNYTRALSKDVKDRLLLFYDRGLDVAGLTVASTAIQMAANFANCIPVTHRGARRRGIDVACLYEAMRMFGYAPDVVLLAHAFDVPESYIFDGTQTLVNHRIAQPINTDDIPTLAVKFACALNFDFPLRMKLEALGTRVQNMRRMCRELRAARPTSLAAGCIWHIVVTNRLTKQTTRDDIQRVTHVAKSTFNMVHKHIKTLPG